MDELSKRIAANTDLIPRYMARNGARLYKWGLTRSEIDSHLQTALWHTFAYRDIYNDPLGEYERFWRFGRREFATVWRERNHVKGLPGQSRYKIHEEPDPTEPDDSGNPADLAECLESLEALTDRQKGILTAIAGSGRQGRAIAQDMEGESVETAEKQLHAIKVALKTGQPPNTQGIKEQIISHLGLEPGKSASIRAKNVLAVARRELSLSIPRGSRYNRRQCDQIMGWLKGNARPQWFAASNPNIQR